MRKLILLLLLVSPFAAFGQVAISASDITDSFTHVLPAARLCFTPVNAAMNPQGFRVGSDQVVPNEVCGTVTMGVLQSGLSVAANPTGVYYHIYVKAANSNLILMDYGMTSITGSTWTLDTYSLSMAVLPVSTITMGTVTGVAYGTPPSCTITGGSPFLLNCSIPAGATGPTGPTGPSGGGGGSGIVNTGSGYALPMFGSGSGTTISPSNVTSDATGNTLHVPTNVYTQNVNLIAGHGSAALTVGCSGGGCPFPDGSSVSDTIISTETYEVNGTPFGTVNLADWTNTSAAVDDVATCTHVTSGTCDAWAAEAPSVGGSGSAGTEVIKTASYTAVSGDSPNTIGINCSSPCTLTLPTPPSSTWTLDTNDEGLAPEIIMPPTGVTIDGVLGAAQIMPGMGVKIKSDGTNYFTNRGAIITTTNVIPAFVQTSGIVPDDGTQTITFPSDVSPGDAIIVSLHHTDAGSSAPGTVTDAQGDTFNFTASMGTPGTGSGSWAVACNVKGGPTTMTTLYEWTVRAAYEFTNVAASACVDASAFADNTGTATSQSTGSITTTVSNDLIFVAGMFRGGSAITTLSDSDGYATLAAGGPYFVLTDHAWYHIQTATGTISDTITSSPLSATDFDAAIIALKPAGATGLEIGDTIAVQPNLQLGAIHAGANGLVYAANGTGTMPTFQAVNPLLGTVNSNVGPCGDSTHVPQVTVTAQGLTTACSPIAITGGGGSAPAPITQTLTSATEADFTTCITSSYDDYEIRLSNITISGSGVSFGLQFSTDGGSTYDAASNYGMGRYYAGIWSGDSPGWNYNTTNTSITPDGNTGTPYSTGNHFDTSIKLYNPLGTQALKQMTMSGLGYSLAARSDLFIMGATYANSSAVDAFRFISSGTFSGKIICQPLAQ